MLKYGKAICYQGYRKEHSKMNNQYPSREQVLEDLFILNNEFDYIRLYDTSQHTIDILEIIEEYKINIKVMISMYLFVEENHENHSFFQIISNDVLESNRIKNNNLCRDLIDLVIKFEDIIFSISVGNEARSIWNVNRVSDRRISELVQIIQKEVKQPVTYCEEWKYWIEELPLTAEAVDFISIHSYPVWNGISIDNAVAETSIHLEKVKTSYPNKEIIITEAGWPTKTDENKIPKSWATIENQRKYYHDINQWAERNNTIVFIFEAFDEFWKGSSDPNDPEKNWGLYDDNRQKK